MNFQRAKELLAILTAAPAQSYPTWSDRVEYKKSAAQKFLNRLEGHDMANFFLDFDSGNFLMRLSDKLAIDSAGELWMRFGERMVMGLDRGDIHLTAPWPDEDEE